MVSEMIKKKLTNYNRFESERRFILSILEANQRKYKHKSKTNHLF